MSRFPRFAPHSTPDILDRFLWWAIRIAAVVFLFSIVGVAFIGTTNISFWLVIISGLVWFVAFVLRWMLHRLWPS
jgi:hypothetical protein